MNPILASTVIILFFGILLSPFIYFNPHIVGKNKCFDFFNQNALNSELTSLLKRDLKDPDSYHPISSYSDGKTITHHYRAKNSFGGYVSGSMQFIIGDASSCEPLEAIRDGAKYFVINGNLVFTGHVDS